MQRSFGLEQDAVTGDVTCQSEPYNLKPGKALTEEVMQYLSSHLSALFRMELGGEEVVFLQRRAVRQYIVGGGYGVVAQLAVVLMHEIHIVFLSQSSEQRAYIVCRPHHISAV
mgnify:CR=1 FL=1